MFTRKIRYSLIECHMGIATLKVCSQFFTYYCIHVHIEIPHFSPFRVVDYSSMLVPGNAQENLYLSYTKSLCGSGSFEKDSLVQMVAMEKEQKADLEHEL